MRGRPFSGHETGFYAIGSFGTGAFSTVPSVLLLYFCTEIVRIPAGVAALIVFVPKLWTLFWDPFVGGWSDRTASRFGRRRPFLVAGAIGTGAAFALLFAPPPLPPVGLSLWVAISYLALVTCYAFFAVPYVAMPAEFAESPADRSRLVGWRMAAAMIGVLAGASLAPMLVAAGGGGRAGYAFMALCLGTACAAFMLCPLLVLHGRDGPAPVGTIERPSLGQQAGAAARDHGFRSLLLAYVLMLAAAGIISASAPYLITRALARREADIGVALGLMLIATSLTAPGLSWAGRRWGEVPALTASVLGYIIAATIVAFAARYHSWPAMLAGFALAGPAFAGLQVLPYTMVAHLIHDRAATGAAAQGTLTGMWTAAEKIGLAAGPLATGLALAIVRDDFSGGLVTFVVLATALLGLAAIPLLRTANARPAIECRS